MRKLLKYMRELILYQRNLLIELNWGKMKIDYGSEILNELS